MTRSPLSRALLAVVACPIGLWAQGGRVVVPVGDFGSVSGSMGSAGASVNALPGSNMGLPHSVVAPASLLPSYNNLTPGPQVVGANPATARAAAANVAPANGSATAAAVTPADSRGASASAIAATPSSPRAATPQAAVAVSPEMPGALPQADDPARRTPEGGPGNLGAVQTAVKDLGQARKDEAAGRQGAVTGRLDALFDFSRPHAAAGVMPTAAAPEAAPTGPSGAASLPDPKLVGADNAYDKVAMFARGAAPAEAPALYERAIDIAKTGSPQTQARVAALKADAAKRAPAALQSLGEKALAAAAAGQTTDAIRYAKAVHGWDALVASPGHPYVTNLAQFTGTVKHVLARALETPGRAAAVPGVRFEPVKVAGREARRARFKFASAGDGPVAAVPSGLAANLALPELKGFVAMEGPVVPEGQDLAAAFALRAQAGFPALFRSFRSQGRSVWSSFWVAARQVSADAAASLWDELKALLVRALQALGILRAAGPSGLLVTPADPAALEALRRLPPERVERPAAPAASADALGLGYRLISAH